MENLQKTKRDSEYILERISEPQNQDALVNYVRTIFGEQMTTEDAIHMVIDVVSLYKKSKDKTAVASMFDRTTGISFEIFLDTCVRILTPLSSVSATWINITETVLYRITGNKRHPVWIAAKTCSHCQKEHEFIKKDTQSDRICPNCGAVMTNGGAYERENKE